MSKLFIVLVVALAAALYFPSSRAWMMEKGSPVVNPILRTATLSEMERIVTDLQQHARENLGRYPDPRQFGTWLEDKYAGNGARDSWNNPYQLENLPRDRQMQVRSWGPDRVRATDDDILVGFQREGR